MVMPRSRSRAMLSSTWDCISRSARPPQIWIRRSASVDLPWSTWAMIEKLRIAESSLDKLRPGMGSVIGRAFYPSALLAASAGPEQPQELVPVQPVATDHRPAPQQHGDVQPVASPEDGIGVHVDLVHGRQRAFARQRGQPGLELLAQAALGPG